MDNLIRTISYGQYPMGQIILILLYGSLVIYFEVAISDQHNLYPCNNQNKNSSTEQEEVFIRVNSCVILPNQLFKVVRDFQKTAFRHVHI